MKIETIVGIASAINAIFSLFIAYLSYKFSTKKYKKDFEISLINDIESEIYECYEDISFFIEQYLIDKKNKNKVYISREKIDLKLEKIRQKIIKLDNNHLANYFSLFSLKISDTTYEKDLTVGEHNLHKIKDYVVDISKELEEIRKIKE